MSQEGKNKDFSHEEKEQKKKKILYVIIAIVAIIAVGFAAWHTYRQQDETTSQGTTAEEITQETTPSATPGDQDETVATMTTTTLPNGETSTYRQAPDHIDGVPDGAKVDRGLAEHQPGDPIPADPNEGVIPTLTAPTTYRGPQQEGPQLTNPEFGPPDVLAQSFVTDGMSLCLRPDTSYNKNLKENYSHLITDRLKEKGLTWGGEDHSTDWKAYQDSHDCSRLTSFASLNSTSVGGEDTIYYDMTINQRVSKTSMRGGSMDTDVPPFRAHVVMKFIDNKWLVDDVQVFGGRMPSVH